MKKALLIALTVLAAGLATAAPAATAERPVNLLLTGGNEQDMITVKLSLDGTSYLISSPAPLEAPSGICAHKDEAATALVCEAPSIASFEVNAGGGDDYIIFSPKIPVAVTLRGGPGEDHLYGGTAADKLVGGPGDDSLHGRGGGDWVFGGPGSDVIYGGAGDDRLLGGPGANEIYGGSGKNQILSGT
ncbi:MAG: serralysin [Solirubrobacterales bacterium]|jgi:Ca2+-binding RTX toxin-like protein|nr:serralysin [Solirubrobacterales bacterium]